MNDQPLVSIICLCYNHADYIWEALDSVVSQTYRNIEIVIVDDNSQDHSKEVIENWRKLHPETIFINNKVNVGNTKAFNSGLKASKGSFIIDFATDDVMLENCISELMEKALTSTHPNVGIVHCNAGLIDDKGNTTGYFFPVDKNKNTIQKIPTGAIYSNIIDSGQIICAVAMLVNRKVYEVLNGYNENLNYEDLDFWIRSSRVFDYEYVDQILCKKRILKDSLGSQYKKKFNKRANKINYSTYKILKSAFEKTNLSKADDLALLRRVHYEISVCLKTFNFLLLLKYSILEMRLRLKKRQS